MVSNIYVGVGKIIRFCALVASIPSIDNCDRLTENITLQEISKEVGLSRCYFVQMFKQSTGIAPYQYIIQQRVEKAKQLLKQDLPLVEVALECGFSSQSSLNRTFRKCVGTTPKGYRQKL